MSRVSITIKRESGESMVIELENEGDDLFIGNSWGQSSTRFANIKPKEVEGLIKALQTIKTLLED